MAAERFGDRGDRVGESASSTRSGKVSLQAVAVMNLDRGVDDLLMHCQPRAYRPGGESGILCDHRDRA